MRILNHAWEQEAVLSTTLENFLGQNSGPNFQSIYRLFGDHYRQIDQWLGELADRTRALGATLGDEADEVAHGARDARASAATGSPQPRNVVDRLLTLHEGIAHRLRNDLCIAGGDDIGTTDFLRRLIEFHETTAWMLRTVAQGGEVPAKAR